MGNVFEKKEEIERKEMINHIIERLKIFEKQYPHAFYKYNIERELYFIGFRIEDKRFKLGIFKTPEEAEQHFIKIHSLYLKIEEEFIKELNKLKTIFDEQCFKLLKEDYEFIGSEFNRNNDSIGVSPFLPYIFTFNE